MENWKKDADRYKQAGLSDNKIFDRLRGRVTRDKLRKYLEEQRNSLKVDLSKKKPKEITLNKNGTQTSETWVEVYNEEQLKDELFLLRLHGYDPNKWTVEWAKSTIWQNYSNAKGTTDLYANKITVKRKQGLVEEDVLEHFIKQAEGYSPVKLRTIEQSGENILLINIVDPHLGQLSWHEESGENYDYKIAVERFKTIILDVIAKSPYDGYDTIYFVTGNDFFNSDTPTGTTTAGTQQTNDVRPEKMFNKGCDLLVWTIDALRTAYPCSAIETILVSGNHDKVTMYHAAKYLYAWFRNDTTVKIDISPMLHKGVRYGKTALLFTHGESELKNLDWVYSEFRHLIGDTQETEIHAGHKHRIKVEEKNGALIRSNPSPVALGGWSYKQGYNSVSRAISRVYSKKNGLEYEIYSSV